MTYIIRYARRVAPPRPQAVDLDDVIELTCATWLDVNEQWRGHLHYLFKRYSLIYEVRIDSRKAPPPPPRPAILRSEWGVVRVVFRPPRGVTATFCRAPQDVDDDARISPLTDPSTTQRRCHNTNRLKTMWTALARSFPLARSSTR